MPTLTMPLTLSVSAEVRPMSMYTARLSANALQALKNSMG